MPDDAPVQPGSAQLSEDARQRTAYVLNRCVPPGGDNIVTWRSGEFIFLFAEPPPATVEVARPVTPVALAGVLPIQPGHSRPVSAAYHEFARGDDNGLWVRHAGGDWQVIGGVLTSDPTAVAIGKEWAVVFVRGADDGIWGLECQQGKCGEWFTLGGAAAGGPIASLSTQGEATVVFQANDGLTYSSVLREGKWSEWTQVQ